MTNDEIKSKQDPWIPTSGEIEQLKEDITVQSKQEETLKSLQKYNKERKTEIVDDLEDMVDHQNSVDKARITKPEDETFDADLTPASRPEEGPEEKLVMSHICPYCGTMAYIGQIHGLGYCKEKAQYQE